MPLQTKDFWLSQTAEKTRWAQDCILTYLSAQGLA
jgi:hypothetical protein